MRKYHNRLTLLILSILIAACQNTSQIVTPTKTATHHVFVKATAFPPTLTLTPTPIPDPQSLEFQASSLCDSSFSEPVTNKQPAGPIMVMLKRTYGNDLEWHYSYILPYHTAQRASDVKTVFCIEESRAQTTSYIDGEPGYRLKWDIRLIELESKTVITSQTFNGENAPGVKLGSGPGYGRPPFDQLVNWTTKNVQDQSVFFIGESVSTMAFSPDGNFVAVANGRVDGVIYSGTAFQAKIFIINMETGGIQTLNGHNDSITQLAFTADGNMLASSNMINKTAPPTESLIKIWDINNSREIKTTKIEGIITGLGFSADNRTLGVLFWDKTAGIDIASGNITDQDDSSVIGFSSNSAAMDQGWNVAQTMNIIEPGTVMSTSSPIFILSPDGNLLVEGSKSGFIKLWNVILP